MQKRLEIHTSNDFHSGPEVAVVEITDTLASRIRQLALAAKALGVRKITEFENSPKFFLRDDETEEEDGSIVYREPVDENEERTCQVECVMLNVTPQGYYWSGLVKHTSIRWETEWVPIPGSQSVLPYLVVVLQGGLVQGLVSNHPELLLGWECLVLDYDTDNAEEPRIFSIPQKDGTTARALAHSVPVETSGIDLSEVVEPSQKTMNS